MKAIDRETEHVPLEWRKPRTRPSDADPRGSPDADLIIRCRAGEHGAFGVLVERYQAVLLRVAYRYLGNWHDAQDAAQEAFVKAYVHLSTYDLARPFRSWLLRVLINQCLDQRRSARNRSAPVLASESVDDRESPADSVDRSDAIQRALALLSPRQRRVLILRDLEGLTPQEVAEIIGCSASTVRVHHFHARNRFREAWLKLVGE